MRARLSWGLGLACLGLCPASTMAQATPPRPQEIFQRLDANSDMVIERSEVPEAALPAFDRLLQLADTNKDGKIEGPEFRSLIQSMDAERIAGVAERFSAMDANSDGKVSKSEWKGAEPMFARLDADKDGFVTKGEIDKAIAGRIPPPAPMAKLDPGPMFKMSDTNGDGKLSRAEFKGGDEQFDQIDYDKDGMISAEEAGRARDFQLAAIQQRFKIFDADGNGKVTKDEFPGQPIMFDFLDLNKDGHLTQDEIRDARQGTGKAQASPTPVKAAKPKS